MKLFDSVGVDALRFILWAIIGIVGAIVIVSSARVYAYEQFTWEPSPGSGGTQAKLEFPDSAPRLGEYPSPSELALSRSSTIDQDRGTSSSETLSDSMVEGADVEKIQETSLPVELVGTSVVSEGISMAVLRNLDSKSVRTLLSGEEWGQFRLEEVKESSVYLWNKEEERREVLHLRRSANAKGLGDDGKQSDEATEISRYRINQSINYNMNNLLNAVDAKPHLDGGRVVGFKINGLNGKPGDLLQQLGFKEGDVITRINGKKVDSVDRAMQLWTQLRNQTDFEIQVLRDGESHRLEYSLTR